MQRMVAALALCAAGCAHDVHVRLPQATPDESVGSIELVLTHSSDGAAIAA